MNSIAGAVLMSFASLALSASSALASAAGASVGACGALAALSRKACTRSTRLGTSAPSNLSATSPSRIMTKVGTT